MYEPSFIIDDSRPPLPRDYVARLNALLAADRRGEAVEYFMTNAVGVPAGVVADMRSTPFWATLEAVAHTLPYDGTVVGDTMSGNALSLRRWAAVAVPTLVMDGGNSPAFMQHGAEELVNVLPKGQHRRLAGQDHGPADDVLVPELVEFFVG